VKVHLMHPDADFVPSAGDRRPPSWAADAEQDLELGFVLDAASSGDALVWSAVRTAMLTPLTSRAAVRYRHEVLVDARAHPDVVRALYDLAGKAIAADKSVFSSVFSRRPELVLDRSLRVLTLLVGVVEELRALVAEHGDTFGSRGLLDFVATVRRDLDDAYLAELRETLDHLARKDGLVMSARLATGGATTEQVPRLPRVVGRSLFSHVALRKPTYSFTVPDRDEAGFEALGALRDRALVGVAGAAASAVDHVLSFFVTLRGEVAFYLGCLGLAARLEELGMPVCLPDVLEPGTDTLDAAGLYDPCLVLRTTQPAVASDVHAEAVRLVVVTGANHGGKSTFLRSVGVAQLLASAGAHVPARELRVSLAGQLFTHWAREEDPALEHGKLDEELARMSGIADRIEPGDLLLSNESFSSTNEAEGSEIGLEVLRALTRAGVRVVAVTHLYDLAHELRTSEDPRAVYLRAPRREGGGRSYRLEPGDPLPTSFARDLYEKEFGRQ